MSPSDVKHIVGKALRSIRQALRGIVSRSVATNQVILAQAIGLNSEQFNGAEIFQQPGLRSNPLAGMQAIIIPLNGKSANGVIVAMSNGKLFVTDLQPGEVAIFNESDGAAVNSIILRNGGIINAVCNTLNVTATQANIAVSGNITSSAAQWNHSGLLNVNGNASISGTAQVGGAITGGSGMTLAGDINADGLSFTNHFHTDPQGGDTSPPQQ